MLLQKAFKGSAFLGKAGSCFNGRSVHDKVNAGNLYQETRIRGQNLVKSSSKEGDLLTNLEEDVKEKAKESNAGKGFGKPQPKPKKKKPQLIQPKLQSESEPESKPSKPFDSQLNRQLGTADKVEETIVRTLAFLFVVFFFEGVFLAIAGFLPEAYDDFAVKYVFPAFTPTLGIFLAISIVYGLLKTREQK